MTFTNVPFSVAAPIIGAAAVFEDEISAQMGPTVNEKRTETAVMAVGANGDPERNTKMGAGAVETCAICEKPGHNARDCLVFMQREGVCGHWSMHHIGKYRSGCNYGDSCRKKHERPSSEPVENSKRAATNATQVAAMATKTVPDTHGGKPVLKEINASDMADQTFPLIPNDTGNWMCCNKVWLQPEDDDTTMCTNCQEGHSVIKPCKLGGRHSGILHQMAMEMSISAVEEQRPFRWMPYGVGVQREAIDANVSLTTATRTRFPVFTRERPATRAQDARFCYRVSAKKMENVCNKKCVDGA